MHSSSFIHCSMSPLPCPLCPWIPLVLRASVLWLLWLHCLVMVSSGSWRPPLCQPASQPASYPYLSLFVSPSSCLPPSCVILLFMLLFPSFSHCAHLTYNYVDDIVVYVASVAATAAAAAVSYCRSSSNKGRGRRRREEEEKRKTMPTSFMCILGSLPLPPLLLMQCTMPIFGPPLILTHYSLSYLQSHSL